MKQTKEFSIDYTYYNEEAGVEVICTLNNKQATFCVQLAGGEFLSQMGCLLIGEEEHTEFKNYFDEIIKAGEDCYSAHVESLKELGDWEEVCRSKANRCSATSYYYEIIERKIDFNERYDDWEFRVTPENFGFTQPNSYSSLPDFTVEYFTTLDDAKKYVECSDEERAYIKSNR